MAPVLVITPVKNAIDNTIKTIKAIAESDLKVPHHVYNDFSDAATKMALEESVEKFGFQLIHLEDITNTPSPNYKLVLQDAQRKALEAGWHLIIVESDVEVSPETISNLIQFQKDHADAGLIGAITTDEAGKVNFPYEKFRKVKKTYFETNRSLSFCCTLLSLPFLKSYSFQDLDQSKDWFDTHISKKSIALGFKNYILMDTPVIHRAHGSRPWKKLKYSNPIKYYFKKFWEGKDKI